MLLCSLPRAEAEKVRRSHRCYQVSSRPPRWNEASATSAQTPQELPQTNKTELSFSFMHLIRPMSPDTTPLPATIQEN